MQHIRNNYRLQPEQNELKLYYPRFNDWLTLAEYHYLKSQEQISSGQEKIKVDHQARSHQKTWW